MRLKLQRSQYEYGENPEDFKLAAIASCSTIWSASATTDTVDGNSKRFIGREAFQRHKAAVGQDEFFWQPIRECRSSLSVRQKLHLPAPDALEYIEILVRIDAADVPSKRYLLVYEEEGGTNGLFTRKNTKKGRKQQHVNGDRSDTALGDRGVRNDCVARTNFLSSVPVSPKSMRWNPAHPSSHGNLGIQHVIQNVCWVGGLEYAGQEAIARRYGSDSSEAMFQ